MTSSDPENPSEELRKALANREFETMEGLQGFLDQYTSERNHRPREDFVGLSSAQMYQMLYFEYESPDLVVLPEVIDIEPEAPILFLFSLLADAIGEKGLKATAKGNLPRNFCRDADLAYWSQQTDMARPHDFPVRLERDCPALHAMRIVAELAGLVRKYRGRFILSRKCRRMLACGGMHAVYPKLLEAYVCKFNWAYRDGFPDMPMIQTAWLFVLYLLARFGDTERPNTFYEDAFMRAFPVALEEVPEAPWRDEEDSLRRCFTIRALERFAGFFGLASVVPKSESPLESEFRVSTLPLLSRSVQFKDAG